MSKDATLLRTRTEFVTRFAFQATHLVLILRSEAEGERLE